MSNITINANSIYDRVIRIGRQTENLVSEITFNVQMWIDEYGAGECVLNVRRNGDGDAYPVPMAIIDGTATWTITDVDTAKKGRGEIQLKYTTGEKVKTSPIFTISCGESLIGEGEPPSGYEDWLTELNRMTSEVEAAKTSASASAQTAQTAAGTATEKATEAEQSAEFAYNHYESARQSAVSAQASKTGAVQAAANAHESATAAAQSAQAASVARTAAEAAAISAQAEAEDAEAAKTAAQTAESNARGFAQTASEKASQAAESATQAQESVTDAQSEVAKAKDEADRAKTYADRAAEVELEIPTKVSQLENDAGYLTEHQSLNDYVRKDVLYDMLPTDTAEGSVASFSDGANNVPVKSLVVGIEPVQDLHGYDSPWPAGGGKNIWDEQWELGSFDGSGNPSGSSTSIRCKNFIPVTPGNTYLYVNNSGNSQAPWLYDANKEFIQRWGSYMASGTTITIPEGCYYIKFALPGTYGATYKNDVAWNYPSTVTTYSPYSNICPITGWTGAKIEKKGKNLFNVPQFATKGPITFSRDVSGFVTASPNNSDPRLWSKDNAQWSVDLKAGVYKLVIQCKTPSSSQSSGWEIYNPSGTKLAGPRGGKFQTDEVATFTVSSDGTYFIIAKVHDSESRFMIVKDGDDTAQYEAYSGETINISFPTEAGTVYGGSLDVTNGVLTVDKKQVVVTSFIGSNKSIELRYIEGWVGNDARPTANNNVVGNVNCTHCKTASANSQYAGIYPISCSVTNTGRVVLTLGEEYKTISDLTAYCVAQKDAGTPVTVCYELATPITYQLTPTEVKSLLGQNNIWADTGDTNVVYRADTSAYIAKKIAEAISALS